MTFIEVFNFSEIDEDVIQIDNEEEYIDYWPIYKRDFFKASFKWKSQSACKTVSKSVMFPKYVADQSKVVAKVCLECSVKEKCLESALIFKEDYGIWGAKTEEELQKLYASLDEYLGKDFRKVWDDSIPKTIENISKMINEESNVKTASV